MAYKPTPSEELTIEKQVFQVAEHPLAPGMPYGQEGRRAVVYQLESETGDLSALKVFKPRFRLPGMVSVAETLEPYASLEGLQACQRIVLTGSKHPDLLRDHPDLTYAVLMPWVNGPTWQEILLDPAEFKPERFLGIARAFSKQLMTLEEKRLAHCDLSGANLIIQPGDQPALVDLEEMYGPDFVKPESLPAGSQGYAHKTAPRGLWSPTADRFAGAVLLAEMLCWHDSAVREASWGESYFAPKDMQTENKRLDVLHQSLETHYGKRILDLFDQAWRSDSLRDCPTFAEWAVALPGTVKRTAPEEVISIPEEIGEEEANDIYQQAQDAVEKGKLKEGMKLYRKAITTASPQLSREIEKQIKNLDQRLKGGEESPIPPKPEKHLERTCPICGKTIPAGQEICPYCEGIKASPKAEADEEKRIKPGVIAGGIGGGLMLIVVLYLMLGRGGIPTTAVGTDTPQPTETEALITKLTETTNPTETPDPTLTLTPTPTEVLDVGSTQISETDGMVQVYIPEGEFLMGATEPEQSTVVEACNAWQEQILDFGWDCEELSRDESPQHPIYISAFWMDEQEVTRGQYNEFIKSQKDQGGFDDTWIDPDYQKNFVGSLRGRVEPEFDDDWPMMGVSWYGAKAYCEWTGRRLPTEAEWEIAARGGLEEKLFPWGDQLPGCAFYTRNGCLTEKCVTSSRQNKSFAPNGYGLYDMAGSVWEWTSDWYGAEYYRTSDYLNPQGPEEGIYRVLRGGSYYDGDYGVRNANRKEAIPSDIGVNIGFRCAESIP